MSARTGHWTRLGSKVFGKYAAHDIFVDLDTEDLEICWAIRTQPKRGLRRFISTIAAMSLGEGPLGRVCGDATLRKSR